MLDGGHDGGAEADVLAEGKFIGAGEGFADDPIDRTLLFLLTGKEGRE
jgi:hypothetical protein